MVISALAAWDGNPGLALGNAFGSNITNIALILGITAIISPIAVRSSVLVKELPLLAGITLFTAFLVYADGELDRVDGWLLILVFCGVMAWSVYEGMRTPSDELASAVDQELAAPMPMPLAVIYLVAGLTCLVISSRLLVWGGIEIAQALGVSDLLIGLTIVAIGTSLPELASCIAAVRKNEHELALGNVIGSNMFNTSIVIGITGVIAPSKLDTAILTRDMPVLGILTLVLFVMGYRFHGPGTGRINRFEGSILLAGYVGYMILLAVMVFTGNA
jgi:cation:H+ antiporter